MDKIKIISDDLASKIAAGEVIENQASIVKELVENSIDAQANKIEITLIDSGFQLIQVIDNGLGMSKQDLLIATYPHATSKISESYDLFNISSLGFRGEALASMVSIARLIISSNDGSNNGYIYDVNNYQLKEGYPNQGTKIEVYNLFYNVPARFKYLKSQTSELANIIDFVSKAALAYPEIAFSLNNDNKEIIRTDGKGDVLAIIAKVYSLDIATNMEELSFQNNDFKVSGYISNKHATKANKKAINIFINKRLVYNKEIIKAIIDGYGTYLMEHRYPIVVLNIEMDYQLVDVNIHPAKLEVKVSKILDLCRLLEEEISKHFNLKQKAFIQKEAVDQKQIDFIYQSNNNISYPSGINKTSKSQETPVTNRPSFKDNSLNHHERETIVSLDENKQAFVYQSSTDEAIKERLSETIKEHTIRESYDIKKQTIKFNVIGQYNGSYILASNEKGLHLIDQHAAMERINYEKIKEATLQEEYQYQELVAPIVLELSLAQKTKILAFQDSFTQLGLELEQQVNNDLIIRRIPTWIDLAQVNIYLENIVNKILSLERVDINKIKKDDLILASCKMSLKANTYLNYDEQQALLDELLLYDDYDHCPHGRPIIISFSLFEIEKMFKRIV